MCWLIRSERTDGDWKIATATGLTNAPGLRPTSVSVPFGYASGNRGKRFLAENGGPPPPGIP